LEIYALFMFLGIFTTLCIPEIKRITLEELSGEDQGSTSHLPNGVGLMDHQKDPNVEEKSLQGLSCE
jgi:PHS family inorganic phosphate transporter-like MFS transporter